jgi:hypothetical protein
LRDVDGSEMGRHEESSGLDSVIELASGAILLWRLSLEARGEEAEQVEQAEHRAAWIVAALLAGLCLYVPQQVGQSLLRQADVCAQCQHHLTKDIVSLAVL